MNEIVVMPLSENLTFGSRIRGLTLETAKEPRVRKRILEIFEDRGLIVFEDVEPSNEMQVLLSLAVGPLKEHPVASVSRVDRDAMQGVVEIASPAGSGGVVEIAGRQLSHWLPWHFDHCYNDELNRGGMLRAVELVPEGGITGFVDGIALYDAFPRDLLARIEGKDIIYTLNVQYEGMRFGRPDTLKVVRPKPVPAEFEAQARMMPRALHPAVWTRDNGEKVLHVSPWMAEGICGAENEEGDQLLEEVCQTINRLAQTCSYQHKWKPTDMLIWDNWRVLHSVSGHDPALGRVMYRTTIKGDYGLGRFEEGKTGGSILSETTV